MSEETAYQATGSTPAASTSSSPRTTIATLSRENSTTSGFDSSVQPKRHSHHKGTDEKRASRRFLKALEAETENPDGYVSDQQPGTLPLPRYPALAGQKPLAPHRVARIAHSFGLASTPSAPPYSHSSFTYRRSTSANSYARHASRQTTATRLLLHVIPPVGLVDGNEISSSQPEDALSQKGSLIPLHTTLQGQLQAIKREYNFPSVAGLILSLLEARDQGDAEHFVGIPLDKEEVWANLWHTAIDAYRREQKRAFLPALKRPSSPPSPSASASADETPSDADLLTPSSSTTADFSPSPSGYQTETTLRPLMTGRSLLTSPSTSTLASTSSFNSIESRSFPSFPRSPSFAPHSATPLGNGVVHRSDSTSAHSDTASFTSSQQLALNYRSPIVGKVEFNIDLHKGRWYDQWAARKRSQPPQKLLSNRASTQTQVPTLSSTMDDEQGMLATPHRDLKASLAPSSAANSEPSPSLAARLDLSMSPRLLSPAFEGMHESEEQTGYAPLEGDGEESDEAGSDYGDERGEITQTPSMLRHGLGLGLGLEVVGAEMNEDEMAWQDLHTNENEHLDDRTRRRRTRLDDLGLNPNLNDPVPEDDAIGVHDATSDLKEVVALWNERQGTTDSQVSMAQSASDESASSEESADASAVIVPVLSSPIVLNVDEAEEPMDMETPHLPVFPLESTRPRNVPPPLHLRAPSDNSEVRLQLVQASPEHSPSASPLTLAYRNGETTPGPMSEGRLTPSASLDLLDYDNRSDASSAGDDEIGSQMRMRDRLDTLERHIAEVSPKLLPDEPEYQSMSPRATPRELLDRIAQSTPRFSAPAVPGTPQFFSNGYARPTPGQPLIATPESPAIGAPAEWPATPYEHVASEMRIHRTTPPSRPISNVSTPPAVNSPVRPNMDEPASRKSLAPSEAASMSSARSSSAEAASLSASTSASRTSVAAEQPPASPGILDPPPRTFSLPQPSSRFSDDSHLSDAPQHLSIEEVLAATAAVPSPTSPTPSSLLTPSPNPNANPNARVSVRSIGGIAKLFRSRSKSRDPSVRTSREFAPPVPIPHPQINSPRAVPPIPPIPSQDEQAGPPPRTPRSVSPIVGKPNGAPRPGHAREDSGSDPFHYDQPQRAGGSSPSSSSPTPPPDNLPRASDESSTGSHLQQTMPASAIRGGKRGILKGWGSSASAPRPNSVRPVAPPPLTPPATTVDSPSSSRSATPQQQSLEHSRSPSATSSLSARGLKINHRESWVAVAENNKLVSSSSASASNGPSPLVQGMSLSEALMSIDEQEATEFAAAAAQTKRRETVSSLRPPISPASTESSQGPRPSVDELSMRSSQFEIVTPSPPLYPLPPRPQRTNSSYIGAERI